MDELRSKLFYEQKNGYDLIDTAERIAIEEYCEGYMGYLDSSRTEREAVNNAIALAEAEGFVEFKPGMALESGSKVYYNNRGKALILAVIGKKPLDCGAVIAGAHVDAPRLDLKQVTMYESDEMCYFKTHYYGGIKKYQWVAIPLELHGVVALKDGSVVDIKVGDRPEDPKFTGFIFKITANIDPNHRSCVAFCKICSGKFVRNTPYHHIRLDKDMRFSSPTQFMAQRKSTIEEAYPGDIIGLPDTGNFKIGDTLTEGELLHFKGLPSFSPEMFKYIENADPMKTKQLAKGIDQLMGEGVAQLFVNQHNGRKLIGTVGQLQFEVIQYRLENEYNAKCRWEPVNLYKACWIESDNAEELESFKKRKYQYMAKDIEGRDVFLADSNYVLQMAQNDFKSIRFHFTSEF